MTGRIDAELALLRMHWPELTYEPAGQWVRLPNYPLPEGWSQERADVAFQIPLGPGGTAPYAFYVCDPLTFHEQPPTNYSFPAGGVPLPGAWGVFSWSPETWPWAEEPEKGANMVSFARSFADRLAEGA